MKRQIVFTFSLTALALCEISLLNAGDPNQNPPCYSIREAKFRGSYVCSVSFSPSLINWKGKEIAIKEAWIERRLERNSSLNPFAPRYKTVKGYHMCFNLSVGWDVLWDNPTKAPLFVFEGSHKSFGSIGTVVLWEDLENIESSEYTVLCTDFEKAIRIKVTPDRPIKKR